MPKQLTQNRSMEPIRLMEATPPTNRIYGRARYRAKYLQNDQQNEPIISIKK